LRDPVSPRNPLPSHGIASMPALGWRAVFARHCGLESGVGC
jgi:hypothetical protein